MARPTTEQRYAALSLQRTHGTIDRVMMEKTDEETGLMWLRWHLAKDALGPFKDRNLFITPDGNRLTWTMQ